ncbi:MAG: PD-(D/E)XK nuclease family protein [Gammaproteobacteria bacterium]|nr:PD-(D/E)XK nuclease family protein [Gammaproteobacteria bacterium]
MDSIANADANASLDAFMEALQHHVDTTIDSHRESIRAFIAGIGPVTDAARLAQRHLERHVAPQFSVFEYFREDEVILSKILADLLSPHGVHGQGTAFLRLLLDEMERRNASGEGLQVRKAHDYDDLEHCEVHTEHAIPQGRIDIVLRIDRSKWIGIENKPWTKERRNQLGDYIDYLDGQDDRSCILFFSGTGNPSGTIPFKMKGRYLTVPYRESASGPSVEHWIDRCLSSCEAEAVRWFLKDLLAYIRRMFGAVTTGGDNDES